MISSTVRWLDLATRVRSPCFGPFQLSGDGRDDCLIIEGFKWAMERFWESLLVVFDIGRTYPYLDSTCCLGCHDRCYLKQTGLPQLRYYHLDCAIPCPYIGFKWSWKRWISLLSCVQQYVSWPCQIILQTGLSVVLAAIAGMCWEVVDLHRTSGCGARQVMILTIDKYSTFDICSLRRLMLVGNLDRSSLKLYHCFNGRRKSALKKPVGDSS